MSRASSSDDLAPPGAPHRRRGQRHSSGNRDGRRGEGRSGPAGDTWSAAHSHDTAAASEPGALAAAVSWATLEGGLRDGVANEIRAYLIAVGQIAHDLAVR
jgi:hypothetical protein